MQYMFVLGIKANYLEMIDDVFTRSQEPLDRCFAIHVGVVCYYFVLSHIFEWLIAQENIATYFFN